jgi:hypothetical protein
MRRALWIPCLALAMISGCSPTRPVAVPRTASSSPASSPSSSPEPTTTSEWVAHGPYLSSPTHLRLLLSGRTGLELVDLDSGRRRSLVPFSDHNGDYWSLLRAPGGVIAQGAMGGNGAGAMELHSWFVPDGLAPTARLLGTSTDVLDEPTGGVWLVDLPHNSGGFGSGTITLMNTFGRTVRTGHIVCCQLPLASIGNGRFVTYTVPDSGLWTLRIYDAFSRRYVRRLTPTGADAEFLRVEGRSIVWEDHGCVHPCTEHVVDSATGAQHDRRGPDGTASPGSTHVAKEEGAQEAGTISIDGRPIVASEDARRGMEWSPDGRWLLFVRPDARHFGIWALGERPALTIRGDFRYLDATWTIFDQR